MVTKRRGVGSWWRALAAPDLDRGLAQVRAQTVTGCSTLPLGSARLLRADQTVELTTLDLPQSTFDKATLRVNR
jgi:hypothetical protein